MLRLTKDNSYYLAIINILLTNEPKEFLLTEDHKIFDFTLKGTCMQHSDKFTAFPNNAENNRTCP